MSPIWCQRWPNIPEARNIGKNEADGAKTAPSCSANQKLDLHKLHAPPHTPPLGQSYINSLRCSSAFCHSCPTKANTNHKIPLKWPNMSPIWCRHSPQWPNISPRSGKHSLTAACPKKETKTKKNRSINHQQRSPQIVFFPGILGVFCKRLAWTKIQWHWNAQVQNKGHRSENSPKWPNMSPIWCQHAPKCPNIAQNGPR